MDNIQEPYDEHIVQCTECINVFDLYADGNCECGCETYERIVKEPAVKSDKENEIRLAVENLELKKLIVWINANILLWTDRDPTRKEAELKRIREIVKELEDEGRK